MFANVSKYGQPPMNVAQGGGVFTTYTVPRGSEVDSGLREINRDLIGALGLVRGVAHAEFIRAHADGHLYFLECAARVGGAYINEMVEAATGLNLWREWARIEIAGGHSMGESFFRWRGRRIPIRLPTTNRKCFSGSRGITMRASSCDRPIRSAFSY